MTISNETQSGTTSRWQLDPGHTLVEFSGKHMFTTVKGHFKSVQGTILLDEADPSRSSVQVEIQANSLYSALDYRDNHLKSPDFLDVENFPTITFKSTRVEPEGNDHAKVIGNLTIHGVTREVVLDTQLTGRGKHPMTGGEVAGFEAKTSINRKDFGLTWNRALETGGFLVGDVIKIEIATEGLKQAS
ncbi:MAG: polyisoprenoid-binding protein [Ktedonobacteraceae bacterium]|nr:polyisoprenoid-binding protein [Ktedonobacteraceae bacterium]